MTSNSTNYSCPRKYRIYNFKPILTPQSRVQRVVHSMLTSRALLQIRAQAGEDPVWSDGLTELSTVRFS